MIKKEGHMDCWQNILDEVIHKPVDQSAPTLPIENKDINIAEHYYLGGQYGTLYLTHREAQCVYHMLQGCTIKGTAVRLSLSPRTVEFYVKNIL